MMAAAGLAGTAANAVDGVPAAPAPVPADTVNGRGFALLRGGDMPEDDESGMGVFHIEHDRWRGFTAAANKHTGPPGTGQ